MEANVFLSFVSICRRAALPKCPSAPAMALDAQRAGGELTAACKPLSQNATRKPVQPSSDTGLDLSAVALSAPMRHWEVASESIAATVKTKPAASLFLFSCGKSAAISSRKSPAVGSKHLSLIARHRSSAENFTPLYRRCAYAASKHALEGFFKSLRTEEKAYGVDVLIAAPAFIATNIGRPDLRAGGIARPGSAEDGVDYMRADNAARIILAGIERRAMIPVGRIARAAWLINRLSPSLYAWFMERRMIGTRRE